MHFCSRLYRKLSAHQLENDPKTESHNFFKNRNDSLSFDPIKKNYKLEKNYSGKFIEISWSDGSVLEPGHIEDAWSLAKLSTFFLSPLSESFILCSFNR